MKKVLSIFMTVALLFSLSITCFASTNYTNQLSIATDENGNVFNDCGYQTGYRYNSSGALVETSYCAITGFIPAVHGDTIRLSSDLWVSNQSSHMQITVYNSSKESLFVGYLSMTNIIDNGYAEYSTDGDGNHIITLNTNSSTWLERYKNTAYIRLTVMANACADGIVTVNEEITEEITPTPSPSPDGGGSGDSGSPDDDNIGENTPETEYVYIKENRPLFETPLTDYSVTEGLLLLLLVTTVLGSIFKTHIRG